jgi:hypothetical protein
MQGKVFKKTWADEVKAWDCYICCEHGDIKIHMQTTTWFPKDIVNDRRAIWTITGPCDGSCVDETITLPQQAETLARAWKSAEGKI